MKTKKTPEPAEKPILTKSSIKAGRGPCPKCGRKGVHIAAHAHAYGYKDRSRITCRFCQWGAKLKTPIY